MALEPDFVADDAAPLVGRVVGTRVEAAVAITRGVLVQDILDERKAALMGTVSELARTRIPTGAPAP